MIDPKLIDYVKSALSRRIPLNQIKKELLSKGWTPHDIDRAMGIALNQGTRKAPNKNTKDEESSKIGIVLLLAFGFLIVVGASIYFLINDEKSKETNLPGTEQ